MSVMTFDQLTEYLEEHKLAYDDFTYCNEILQGTIGRWHYYDVAVVTVKDNDEPLILITITDFKDGKGIHLDYSTGRVIDEHASPSKKREQITHSYYVTYAVWRTLYMRLMDDLFLNN